MALYCRKCGVSVRGSADCPLCQAKLEGGGAAGEDAVFPILPPAVKEYHFFLRVAAFISVVVVVVCLAINLLFPEQGRWSLFVLGGVPCVWVSLAIAVTRRHNIPKNILWQVFAVSAIAVIWDLVTGWRGWSINYVFPFLCVVALLAMALTARILNLKVGDYMFYLAVDGLFGVVPIVFYFTGILYDGIPSVISVAASLVSLAALFLFEGAGLAAEVRRKLHL